jgi:alanine racemase
MTPISQAGLGRALPPALPASPPDPVAADQAQAVLQIDLAAIADNWRTLCAAHGGRPTAAVVKADAYGLGADRVAPFLHAAGCRHFFTAHLAEAVAIRELVPDSLLAALNGPVPGSEPDYLAHGVMPVLASLADIDRWSALARRTGRPLAALLHIDTGMARLGLDAAEVSMLAGEPERLHGVAVRYLMTHFVAADVPDDPLNAEQLRRFAAACARLPPAPHCLANSAALYLGPAYRSDLARPGIALYGGNPTAGQTNPMRPVARLCARVLRVRNVAQGESVGYNATWRATRPSRVAILGVGYADGWPRALTNRGSAAFGVSLLPLVGRVSMDLSAYDVTDRPDIAAGDWLDLIGPGCTLERVAQAAGTISYEILTSLGHRYARVWTT